MIDVNFFSSYVDICQPSYTDQIENEDCLLEYFPSEIFFLSRSCIENVSSTWVHLYPLLIVREMYENNQSQASSISSSHISLFSKQGWIT